MIEIVVVSGKGGTGKTLIASTLLYYLNNVRDIPSIGVDTDAEAPDLAIALGGYTKIEHVQDVYESRKAEIDYNTCTRCLECVNKCQFYAMTVEDGTPKVQEELCEGCGVCALVCPIGAIRYKTVKTGQIIIGKTRSGIDVITADLTPSGRNTGHLVYEARRIAREKYSNRKVIVVDSAPGIGCPVISSLVGANFAIIVIEPSELSIQGASRIQKVLEQMNIDYGVIINKSDLNPELTSKIVDMFGNKVLGELSYFDEIVRCYANMIPVLENASRELKSKLEEIFLKILDKVRLP